MATFKAKTRAVELLGKGQIADLPTAVTELWKNGYDAYAKNLECRLFLETYKDNKEPLFLVSDDGFGMSKTDIETRWFVLGTDSKARGQKIIPQFGLALRNPMGEKGIGRLSVSYLGSQLIMLSKKRGEKASGLFIDWRVLDNYDFFLEDLQIPLYQFDSVKEFNAEFKKAKTLFNTNLDSKKWSEQEELCVLMQADLEAINLPGFVLEDVIEKFCQTEYHGTTFLILTPHDQLIELSEKDRINFKDDPTLTYLRSSLSGLHNDLKNPKTDFETHFFLHDAAGKYDVIDEFITQDEMRNADHWLKGEFDENGFFSGEIRVFDRREKYVFKPNRPPGITPYGPFSMEWGAIEGEQPSSLLNKEQYTGLSKKLDAFGGLYVYRDDFRVLPYGRTDFDFLEFEKRRTNHAGKYFFSHRRMIGYISIGRDKNGNLKDKAGREGFIQNKAYREFKDDLVEMFIDIGTRYMFYDKKSDNPTFRQLQIDDIKRKYEKQEEAAKKKNAKTRKAFLESLEANKPRILDLDTELVILQERLALEAKALEVNYNSYNALVNVLEERRSELRGLKVTKPQAMKLNPRQEKEYLEYQKSYAAIGDRVIVCVKVVEDTRGRINAENLKLEYNQKLQSHIKYLERLFSSYQKVCKDSLNRVVGLLTEEKETQVNLFVAQSESTRVLTEDDKEVISAKINLLDRIAEEQKTEIEHSVGGFIHHISNLQIDVDDDFLREWYEKQNQNLEVKLQDYEELAQLGMAIEIIDHQFNVMYSQMNDAVHEIDQFSRRNKGIESSFKQLQSAFQHLEGNYKLLKPLYRTSRRTREVITGKQIEDYIKLFFQNEFKRFRIVFSVNDDFRDYEFFTYDSIIKPVFLNLINNANYWLIPSEKREIRIELIDGEIRVMNSGEPIDDTYLEDIFTLFFTRKRDGRGIGLYLARKSLNAIGYNLFATNDKNRNQLKGACFVISKEDGQ